MNAHKNVPCIILMLAVAFFASVMLSQTVVPAPRNLKPFPKPTSPLMRGVDTACGYFFRSTISGKDRVAFYLQQDNTTVEVSVLFTNIVVIRGENDVPTTRPLDGDWDSQVGRWEFTMSQTARDMNGACLPPFKTPQ